MLGRPEYKLRQATNQDITAVKGVVFTVLQEYGLAPEENGLDSDLFDLEENYNNNNGYFGVILDPKNRIVGTFGLYHLNKTNCEIRKMYFLPQLRGKGWGKKIMRFLITKALEKGYSNIILETNSVLKEAISLYEKCGFKEYPEYNIHGRCDKAYILKIESVFNP